MTGWKKSQPAKRTGNGFANFHTQNLTAPEQSAMVQTERGSVSRSTAAFQNVAGDFECIWPDEVAAGRRPALRSKYER